MYRIALCEDEKIFSEVQKNVCRRILEKMNIEHRISVFESSAAFEAAFSDGARYDLILLDIVMDGTDGMELAKKIRSVDRETAIIFITSSKEHVFQGYDVNALHYLMKPVDEAVLERLIGSAYKDKYENSFLVFKSGELSHRVALNDIISLETKGRKVEITLADRALHCPGKVAELLDKLPKDSFIRCHQAFAVNIHNVRELTRFEAIAVNGKRIPISRHYLKDIQTAFLMSMQGH